MVPSLWSLMGQSAQSVDPVGLAPSQPASLHICRVTPNSGKPSISSLILGRNFMFFQLAAFPSYLKPLSPPVPSASDERPTALPRDDRAFQPQPRRVAWWVDVHVREVSGAPGGVAFTQPAVTSC